MTVNIISNVKYIGTESKNIDAYGIFAQKAQYLDITNNSISGILGSGYGASTLATAQTNSTFGIFLDDASSSNINIYYNSVNLFGAYPKALGGTTYYAPSGALCINNSSISSINVINNIFTNSIVANSTLGNTNAYAMYIASGFTFNGTSAKISNNDYYVDGSGANLAYYNSNSIPTFTSWTQTVANDLNSLNLEPKFNGNSNLSLLPSTTLNGKAIVIAGISKDLRDVIRSTSAPSIGAYELTVDEMAPTFSFQKLDHTSFYTNRTINAIISDNYRGVDTIANLPRLYYKKSSSPNDSLNWKYTVVSGYMNDATFTLDYSKLSNIIAGDTIQYFIVQKI